MNKGPKERENKHFVKLVIKRSTFYYIFLNTFLEKEQNYHSLYHSASREIAYTVDYGRKKSVQLGYGYQTGWCMMK